ncbi:SRPBCC family protein [Kitasatospora sp. NPDC048545]|uniref:SRPBCC family protein n=1 Tax=Kitasatospora sp. NPDC048545 TaxID=3157208 RepID=UPI0033E534A8
MSVRHVLVERPPETVWRVLADPSQCEQWVPRTARIRSSTGRWPQIGSGLEYTATIGPLRFHGQTVVRINEPRSRLELETFAGRLGSARITVELVAWGAGTLVVMDEHPLHGRCAGLHGPPVALLLHLLHRRALSQLVDGVEQSLPRVPEGPADTSYMRPATDGSP